MTTPPHTGVNHVQWARVGRRLANLYKRQNRSAEAEGILLRILNQVIGMSDLERIRTANSIAILQKKQGKLEEAEGMYLCALTCYEAASPASPSSSLCREDYLSTLNNLGLLYKTIRDYPRSREYYDRAHIGRQQLLGNGIGTSSLPCLYFLPRVDNISGSFDFSSINCSYWY